MEIIDLNNKPIVVTDLKGAIQQAKMFAQYRHNDTSYSKSDDELNAYWKDMHEKLLALQSQLSNCNSSP